MKLLSRLAVMAAVLAISTAVWAQDVVPAPDLKKPLTIEDALAIAFAYNPELGMATAHVNKARGGVVEARARFMPSFNIQGTQLYQGPPVAFSPAPDSPPVNIIPPTQTSARFNVLLPLDVNGALHYATAIAKDQFQINYLGLLQASEQLIAQVKKSYYEVLRARGQAETAQAAVDVAAARLKNTQAWFEAGTVPKFDVTTAQVDLANLNQQLIGAQSRASIALANFNRVLGISPDSQTQVASIDVPVTVTDVDIPTLAKTAKANRPEVRIQQQSIHLTRENIKLQRTGLRPSLGLAGTYSYVSTQAFSNANLSWQANAVLSIPIWDGGVTKGKVDQAFGDLQAANAGLLQAELLVSQEVSTAALTLEEAAKRTQSTAASVTLAEEALRLANVRYEGGIAVLVEVTNAESQLTRARFFLVDAQYDYAIALAELQRATSSQPELEKLRLIDCSALLKTASKPAAK